MNNNNNKIILLVGASGSGKSTTANILEQEYNLKQILSYTTRPMRKSERKKPTHTYITDEEFDNLTDLVGYTEYNGYRYCATAQQVETHEVYVIDPKGVDFFKENYKGDKEVIVIFLYVPHGIRRKRMLRRGDSEEDIAERFFVDDIEFEGFRDKADYIVNNTVKASPQDVARHIYHIWEGRKVRQCAYLIKKKKKKKSI